MRKAAVEEASKAWSADQERLVRQERSLRAKLDVAAEQNKRLLSEKNALQVRQNPALKSEGIHRSCLTIAYEGNVLWCGCERDLSFRVHLDKCIGA